MNHKQLHTFSYALNNTSNHEGFIKPFPKYKEMIFSIHLHLRMQAEKYIFM